VTGVERDTAPDAPGVSLRAAVTAALGGPAAWFADLCARFFLVEFGVARAREPAVLAVGVAFLTLAVGASVTSHRLHARAKAKAGELEFVTALGVALGAFSALVIAAALIPHIYFDGGTTP
jgi:hypothetical protein